MVFFMGSENKGNPAGGDDRNTRTTYSPIELIAESAVELLPRLSGIVLIDQKAAAVFKQPFQFPPQNKLPTSFRALRHRLDLNPIVRIIEN